MDYINIMFYVGACVAMLALPVALLWCLCYEIVENDLVRAGVVCITILVMVGCFAYYGFSIKSQENKMLQEIAVEKGVTILSIDKEKDRVGNVESFFVEFGDKEGVFEGKIVIVGDDEAILYKKINGDKYVTYSE